MVRQCGGGVFTPIVGTCAGDLILMFNGIVACQQASVDEIVTEVCLKASRQFSCNLTKEFQGRRVQMHAVKIYFLSLCVNVVSSLLVSRVLYASPPSILYQQPFVAADFCPSLALSDSALRHRAPSMSTLHSSMPGFIINCRVYCPISGRIPS